MNKIVILIVVALCLSSSAFSQIVLDGGSNRGVNMELLKPVIKFNSAVIGNAQACSFDSNDITRVKNDFVKRLLKLNLTDTEARDIQNQMEASIVEFRNKGKNNTKVECDIFKEEFQKILKLVKD